MVANFLHAGAWWVGASTRLAHCRRGYQTSGNTHANG